ncbi:MAG: hypothetical protein HONDAALG_02561 [Gammaproteobacteria bacterium]|nr:hypothetical protein [Gammaproteobacteria bacterium]
MRAVVVVKSNGGKGGGASRAARYISERDRDPGREGARPRSLFSDRDDDLTYRKANRFLGNGQGAPGKDDLIHFSVSFLSEDYERLGASGDQRKERLREVAREAMEDVKSDLDASDLRWVAGIHLNTDHPHLHILIHKEITGREEGESRRLGRLPKRLLPHRAPASDGEARAVEGSIGERFVAALDRAQGRAGSERESNTEEKAEKTTPAEERLLQTARYNPSIAGRELVEEIILRGSEPGSNESPEAMNLRIAFRNPGLDDPDYRTRPEQADWLNRQSQDLRDLYERGACVKDDVLVIPAEEHELPDGQDQPFITSLSYALGRIRDAEQAREFHTLARSIAGENADPRDIEVFRYYYDQIGRDAAALEPTLDEMRLLAGEMAKLETQESVEVFADMVSLEEKREPQSSAGAFNTAARKVRLDDERLRFPADLSVETKERLVRLTIPAIDGLIEGGMPRSAIAPRIDAAIYHREAPETDDERHRISGFLKAYVDERLKDPETRALNRSASFRQAHSQIVAATTPEELNRVAESFLRQNLERSTALRNGQSLKPNETPLSARERNLLFFGRAPEHHTAEMLELRHAWGLSRAERAEQVAAISEGRLEPSPTLARMLAELESRRSVSALRHYQASILNEEMRNPGKVNLRHLYERLPPYERTYLVEQIEGRKQAITRPSTLGAPAREPAQEASDRGISSPHESDSYRDYMAGVTEIEQRLLNEAARQRQKGEGRFGVEGAGLSTEEARALLPTEEQTAIRNRACNQAWERLALPETYDAQPGSAAQQLGDAIAQLQEEIQPRARLAARALDDFLEKKIGHHKNDQSREDAVRNLSPADAQAWRELEAYAAETRRELYRGFESLDLLRREVARSRAEIAVMTTHAAPEPAGTKSLANGRSTEMNHREHGEYEAVNQGSERANPMSFVSPVPQSVEDVPSDRSLSRWFREVTQAHSALDSWDPENPDAFGKDSETLRDRHLLGQAIETTARRELAELNYNLAVEAGDTFRFEVRDESSGERREISDFDVRRRAGARGSRAADEGEIHTTLERRAAAQQVVGRDLALHAETFHELGEIRQALVERLEKAFTLAAREETEASARAQTIERKYASEGQEPPPPLLDRGALAELQEKATSHSLARRAEQFEALRLALAAEHNQPARTDEEAARLAAQLFTARTELAAREARADRFDQTRHLRQWEIGDEKWSLADLDRQSERQTDDAKLLGKYQIHLRSNGRERAGEEVERLAAIRETVVGRIAAEQREMQEEVQEAGKLVETLSRIETHESAFRAQAGQAMPEPLFTRKELDRAAANLEVTRDAATLRQLHEFEKQFNTYAPVKERRSPEQEVGRALARETMAEIFQRESAERVVNFQMRSDLQPLRIELPGGGLLTKRLEDTKPNSLAERVLRPLIERGAERELHDSIRTAFDQYRNHLLSGHEKSLSYLAAAREIAGLLHAETKEHTGVEKAAPDFTPKERINIEIYAERLTDPKEREHYLRLSRGETTPDRSSRDPIERASGSDSDRGLAQIAHQFLSQGAGRAR